MGATDAQIVDLTRQLAGAGELAVGIDSPLSYGVPSGSRPADRELRAKLVALGGKAGTVMAPTAPWMVCLTLRGVALSRMLTSVEAAHAISIVEIHPGAAFLLRGAPVADVYGLNSDPDARGRLINWLGKHGMAVT